MRRLLAGGLAGALLVVLAFTAPAAQAGTAAQSTSCKLSSSMMFKPGLLESQQQRVSIKIRVMLRGCVGGGVTKAHGRGGGVGTISCSDGSAVAKVGLKWNTGETTALNLEVDLGAQTVAGQIVDGKFKGEDLTTDNIVVTALIGDCVNAPLKKVKVTATLGL